MEKYDVLIIGCGIAGLTASVYSARANLKTAIIEKGAPGGKLVNISQIENWIGDEQIQGADLAIRMWNHSKKEGTKHIYGDVLKINYEKNIVITNVSKIKYNFLIIATGTSEKIPKNVLNIDKFYQKGVSYCVICDGPLYKDENAIIIGGGNSAFEEAIYLSTMVKNLKIFVRNKISADKGLLNEVLNRKNIEIIQKRTIKEIYGDKKVKYIIDSNGIKYNVKVIFPYIGLNANTNFISQKEILNDYGFIKVNDMMQTQIPNIFAIGDVIDKKIRQFTTAAADGTIAVKNIINLIKK